jgi:predicted nucleic-acid-binding Zn-ribbon protein
MPLDQNQSNTLQKHLNKIGFRPQCQACGANNWAPGEIITPPVYSGGGIQIGGPNVPMVQVICEKCGYVVHFAAVLVGLLR